ncbi:unnamed protein product [Vicia faba]|uniref:Uncharacterized protein n=1 Tax=Vicia faba TaxID=3906 RepID=A0AAV0ZK83_VICFA|nr:unnamed protein product [Vicia faba]
MQGDQDKSFIQGDPIRVLLTLFFFVKGALPSILQRCLLLTITHNQKETENNFSKMEINPGKSNERTVEAKNKKNKEVDPTSHSSVEGPHGGPSIGTIIPGKT